MTATVREGGQPVNNRAVTFSVTGANPQTATTRTTNASGEATFAYTGTAGGTDTIRASFTDSAGQTRATTATRTWFAFALGLTPATSTGPGRARATR